jgi:VWFA-related protein
MTRAQVVAPLLLAVGVAGLAATDQRGATPSSSPRVIYALAIDERGVPVTDLTPADFIVKEDGKVQQVTAAETATAPPQIAIIVDDNGTGIFRYGLADFVQRFREKAEIALTVVQGQTRKVVDYTTSFPALMAGINELGVRPATPDGGQLLEGIYEAAKELNRREAQRPVIIALTVGGEEHSTLTARYVLDQLHQSRAALHVVFAGSRSVRTTSAANRPADLLEGNLHISEVLGDGPKQSGGRRHDVIPTNALFSDLQQIARELKDQYVVTYLRPDSVKSARNIDVSVGRRGVTVIAPSRAPIR